MGLWLLIFESLIIFLEVFQFFRVSLNERTVSCLSLKTNWVCEWVWMSVWMSIDECVNECGWVCEWIWMSVWMSMDECVNEYGWVCEWVWMSVELSMDECGLNLLGWHGMNISRHTLTLIYFMNSNLIVELARKWSHKIHTHLHISWKQKQNKHTHTHKQKQQQQKHKQPLLTHPPLPPHKLIPIQKKKVHT